MKQVSYILFFASTFIYSCKSNNQPENSQETAYCLDADFKKKIEIISPSIQPIQERYHLNGSVESNPEKMLKYTALASGVVTNVYFALGDKVTKGQVLAELKSTDLSALQAELATLDNEIKVAERKLNATKSMYADGISSQKELLADEGELATLRSKRTSLNSNLQLFGGQSGKNTLQIKAPSAGIIIEKNINPGMQIAAQGEELFTIADLSDVWVMANIYTTNINRIHTGMPVDITTLSYPDEKFSGKISAMGQVLHEDSKVLNARINLNNADFKLKPGMQVDITAIENSEQTAISIPTSAIIFDDNQYFVVIYKDDCNLEIRKIKLLTQNNELTYIDKGITTNDKIIAKNQLLIYEKIR